MVLRFAMKTGSAPSPVEVRGPTIVENPSLSGYPLGPTGPMGPGAPSHPGGPVLPCWPLCPLGPREVSLLSPPLEGSSRSSGGPPAPLTYISFSLSHLCGLLLAIDT